MDVIDADMNDVKNLEVLARKCFDFCGFTKYGIKYEPSEVKIKFVHYIMGDKYHVKKFNENNRMLGFLIFSLDNCEFSSQKQFTQIHMNVDTSLTQVKRAKVILDIMDYAISYVEENKVDLIAFSILPEFDISANLMKKGFELSDKILIRGPNYVSS